MGPGEWGIPRRIGMQEGSIRVSRPVGNMGPAGRRLWAISHRHQASDLEYRDCHHPASHRHDPVPSSPSRESGTTLETAGPGQTSDRVIAQARARNGTGTQDIQVPRAFPSPAGNGGLEYRAQPSRAMGPYTGTREQSGAGHPQPGRNAKDPRRINPRQSSPTGEVRHGHPTSTRIR